MFNKPLSNSEYDYLIDIFPYFKRLTANDQREFAIRVHDFIFEKEFTGKGIQVTSEMKLLIAAYATQISFGLPRTILLHFKKVVVHPKPYVAHSGLLHKGEVNPISGHIHLSWPDLLQGLADPSDGIDLGIHEMAHALWFEDDIFNAEMDFLSQETKAQWQTEAQHYVRAMRAGKKTIFRKYGSVNTREFFSVAVEHFFERSEEFLQHEPQLYGILTELLGQDPANRIYRIE